MWIEQTQTTDTGRPVVTAMTVDGERIEFTETGKANVSRALGERLIEASDVFVASGDDGPSDDESETADATDAGDEPDETASTADDGDED